MTGVQVKNIYFSLWLDEIQAQIVVMIIKLVARIEILRKYLINKSDQRYHFKSRSVNVVRTSRSIYEV